MTDMTLHPHTLPIPGTETVVELPPETATQIGIEALPVCRAEVKARAKAGVLYVRGRLQAQAVQSCVVTGEPVTQHIDRAFAIKYVPDYTPKRDADGALLLDIDASEETEALPADGIRLHDLVREELILALDPYPRASDAAVISET